ncbi:MAG: hypothetical protein E6517_10625, partial [Intestinibacter bartlettii]|nr:hypothetical protein [Intestinibacter bartlettii]
DTNMSGMIKITTFMQEVIDIVKNYYNIVLNEDSLDFGRFITHLKYFSQRLFRCVINRQRIQISNCRE